MLLQRRCCLARCESKGSAVELVRSVVQRMNTMSQRAAYASERWMDLMPCACQVAEVLTMSETLVERFERTTDCHGVHAANGPQTRETSIAMDLITCRAIARGTPIAKSGGVGAWQVQLRCLRTSLDEASVAARSVHWIDAAGPEFRAEADNPIAFRKHRRPPDHGSIVTRVDHVVDLTW